MTAQYNGAILDLQANRAFCVVSETPNSRISRKCVFISGLHSALVLACRCEQALQEVEIVSTCWTLVRDVQTKQAAPIVVCFVAPFR